MIANEAAANVARIFQLHGPAFTQVTACASGTDAIGQAIDLIRSGRADLVVAGGTEAAISQFAIAGFINLRPSPRITMTILKLQADLSTKTGTALLLGKVQACSFWRITTKQLLAAPEFVPLQVATVQHAMPFTLRLRNRAE